MIDDGSITRVGRGVEAERQTLPIDVAGTRLLRFSPAISR